ncbi:hypothetical protein BKA70DRAFT_241543 [Coprinopsis sp. MPI-PUGE-AT-0042]|nr:hypothetical protein BKA70DRAFT_241543 [Coprinopsis sp. MPI-PUGE-AT-0042]
MPSASLSSHTTNGSTTLVNSPKIGHQLPESKNRAFGTSLTLARRRRARGSPTICAPSSLSARERRFAFGSRHLDPGGTRVVCEQVEDTVGVTTKTPLTTEGTGLTGMHQIHAGDMQRGSVMMGLLDVGPERNQRLNSRHRRHSLLHPPEARSTTMIATNHTSAPLDFLERPSADVEANR